MEADDALLLSHYTDLTGFEGITGTGELWCTGIRHLNDRTEYHYVHEAALQRLMVARDGLTESEHVRRLQFVIDDGQATYAEPLTKEFLAVATYYVAALSEQKDDLSQWRGYGQGGGIELRFQRGELRALAATQNFTLVKCGYDVQKLIAELDTAVADTVQQLIEFKFSAFQDDGKPSDFLEVTARSFWARVVGMAPRFKHPSFRAEQEWRLVSSPPENWMLNSNKVRYRVRSGRITPYLPFKIMKQHAIAGGDPFCDAVKQVILGPGADSIDIVTTMQMLLHRRFPSARIGPSNVPYAEPRR